MIVREATHLGDAVLRHARTNPAKTALSDSRTTISYDALDRFSSHFARHLAGHGCEPGDRVAMVANRRAILVAAILGTFKAGCVHVPLDPRMPASRLEYILDDVAPSVVITEDDLRDDVAAHLPASTAVLVVEDLEKQLVEARYRERDPAPTAGFAPDSAAYCIYTSGSTGRPKGVVIEHRSLTPFFEGTREFYDVTEDSVCASFSPLHFDVYLMDMLFPLNQGAELHVHDDVVVPDLLFGTIRDNGVTHFSAWGMMLGLVSQAADFDGAPLPHVRTVLTGTDVPDVKTVQRWLAKNNGVRVINAYGPTEVTCASTAHLIREREPDRQELYPIGLPLRHVHAFLVGDDDELIEAPEVPGELLVGGVQVMRSYWNKPEETEQRITWIDGIRCYRTGDICSYLDDGSIFYHGRKDNEVNIGGYRIHLNEVQRVIGTVAGVHGSEVVLLESRYGEKLLAAGVVLDHGHLDDDDRHVELIRRRLADELPGYMIPRHVVVLERFPQLSSGKTDRTALTSILQGQIEEKDGE